MNFQRSCALKKDDLQREYDSKKESIKSKASSKRDEIGAKVPWKKDSLTEDQKRNKEDFIAGARDLERDAELPLLSYYGLSSEAENQKTKRKRRPKV